MDFISHVFRCMELVDLGEYTEATAACTRARELDPTHMWGPLATSWIARAQGKTDEAMQWIDAARKLQPQDTYLVDQKIDLLLAQEKFADARAVMRELPPDESFFSLARESNIVYAESGGAAVKAWMARTRPNSQGRHRSRAHRARAHAAHLAAIRRRRAPPWPMPNACCRGRARTCSMAGQIRHEYSVALMLAGIELKGGGDKARAMQILQDLDRMLRSL